MHPTRKGAFALPLWTPPIDPPDGGGADAAKGSLPALPFGFPIGQGFAPLHRTKGGRRGRLPPGPPALKTLPRISVYAAYRSVNLFLMP